jgi:hypothetical protein
MFAGDTALRMEKIVRDSRDQILGIAVVTRVRANTKMTNVGFGMFCVIGLSYVYWQ